MDSAQRAILLATEIVSRPKNLSGLRSAVSGLVVCRMPPIAKIKSCVWVEKYPLHRRRNWAVKVLRRFHSTLSTIPAEAPWHKDGRCSEHAWSP